MKAMGLGRPAIRGIEQKGNAVAGSSPVIAVEMTATAPVIPTNGDVLAFRFSPHRMARISHRRTTASVTAGIESKPGAQWLTSHAAMGSSTTRTAPTWRPHDDRAIIAVVVTVRQTVIGGNRQCSSRHQIHQYVVAMGRCSTIFSPHLRQQLEGTRQ